MAKRASLSALLGSTVEYYDFTLFATASALVFNKVFFAPLGTASGLLASFATFGVAYAARPLGALVFGSLGDKVGRKSTLLFTLSLMGVATFLVGLIPSYATIGAAAPVILVLLRLLQGVSAGGEQAGSNSLSLEHAPQNKRGLYTSWTMQGTSLGTLLASVAFLAVAGMGKGTLLAWGWRIPFLVAGPLLMVTYLIRRGVDETSRFLETKEHHAEARVPIAAVLRDHWVSVLRVMGCSLLAVGGSTLGVFLLGYATGTVKVPATDMIMVLIISSVVGLVAQPLWAALSDRVGRRPVFALSMIATAIFWFPFFWIVSGGNFPAILAAACVFGVLGTGANAVGAAMYTEMFPTRVRFTGVAIGTQLGFVVAGFAPAIEASIQGHGANGWVPVAMFAAATAVVATIAAWAGRETRGLALEEIDLGGGRR